MDIIAEHLLLYIGVSAVAAFTGGLSVTLLWDANEEAERTGRPIYKDDKFIVGIGLALFTLIVGWPAISALIG